MNSDTPLNQTDLVAQLLDVTRDGDHNVSVLDLLDGLASLGLRLVPDPGADSSIAYQAEATDEIERNR